MKISREQRRGMRLAKREYETRAARNIKNLEQEKEKLVKMLENVPEDDEISRNALIRAKEHLDDTIEQIRSAKETGGLIVQEED